MKKGVESSVYRVVVATAADYNRMKRAIDSHSLGKDQALELSRKVNAIDNALLAVCEGECDAARSALLSDIARMRGFKNSAGKAYYASRATYTRRKREAVRMIAIMLGLV
jgi:hypothetical protein